MMFPTSSEVLDFKSLFEDITYDWPYIREGQAMARNVTDGGIVSYHINKTDIFENDGKFYKSYKTECNEITKEAFEKTELLYQLLYGDLNLRA